MIPSLIPVQIAIATKKTSIMSLESLPKTFKAYRRTIGPFPRTIELSTENLPQSLSPNEVLIKIHAVSLNYRDHAMLSGRYPIPVDDGAISASDCAAEVIAVGSDVKAFTIGDHVSVSTLRIPFHFLKAEFSYCKMCTCISGSKNVC